MLQSQDIPISYAGLFLRAQVITRLLIRQKERQRTSSQRRRYDDRSTGQKERKRFGDAPYWL